jgi:hypothetical protein
MVASMTSVRYTVVKQTFAYAEPARDLARRAIGWPGIARKRGRFGAHKERKAQKQGDFQELR